MHNRLLALILGARHLDKRRLEVGREAKGAEREGALEDLDAALVLKRAEIVRAKSDIKDARIALNWTRLAACESALNAAESRAPSKSRRSQALQQEELAVLHRERDRNEARVIGALYGPRGIGDLHDRSFFAAKEVSERVSLPVLGVIPHLRGR